MVLVAMGLLTWPPRTADGLVRIEDIDPPREIAGSARRILQDLQRFGLRSDRPVLCQSTRRSAYERALRDLLERGLAFWCGCSRSELPRSGVYPGTCRPTISQRPALASASARISWRFHVPDQETIRFHDQGQGPQEFVAGRDFGDFVIWRADDLPAYQLAVVVDDAFQQVTQVVRGADLLDSTARQIYLQQCLGLPSPTYAHFPVCVGTDGKKLSKRAGSDPIVRTSPAQALGSALRFLGQPCPSGLELDSLWRWARHHWDLSRVPRQAPQNRPAQY
jgi:glutamyl-Q tRNA(Asp) synthetase